MAGKYLPAELGFFFFGRGVTLGRGNGTHPPSCSGAAPPGLCRPALRSPGSALPRLCPAAPLGEGELAFRAVFRLSTPLLLKNNPPPLQPPFLMLLASLRGCRQGPPAGRQERSTRVFFFFFTSSPGHLSRVGEPCTNSLSGMYVPPIPRWKCPVWSKHSWYLGNKTPAVPPLDLSRLNQENPLL